MTKMECNYKHGLTCQVQKQQKKKSSKMVIHAGGHNVTQLFKLQFPLPNLCVNQRHTLKIRFLLLALLKREMCIILHYRRYLE